MNIYLAPVQFSNTTLLHYVINATERVFQKSKTEVIKLPLDVKPAFYSDRGQYFSTQLLADSIKITNHLNGKVLILVEFDLFVPVFTYVFGEAQLNGKHSIVSVSRFHEELYSGKSNEKLLQERTEKEVLHELGHNFGLIHCKSWECVMHQSQGVEEIDIKGGIYCEDCLEIIESKYHL